MDKIEHQQQLARKRRIGNDISVIIFQEGGVYTPPIKSNFLRKKKKIKKKRRTSGERFFYF